MFGGGIIDDVLEIRRGKLHELPRRLGHGQPVPIRAEPPFSHPLGLLLFCRDQADDLLVQTGRRRFRFDVGVKAVFVFLFDQAFDGFSCCAHAKSFFPRTIRANPVDRDFVVIHLETLGSRHGRRLRRPHHVKDGAAAVAVIVAMLFHVRAIPCRAALQLHRANHAAGHQRVQAVVNRRQGNLRQRPPGAPENLFRRRMIQLLRQHVEHGPALRREAQTPRVQPLAQPVMRFAGRIHRRDTG